VKNKKQQIISRLCSKSELYHKKLIKTDFSGCFGPQNMNRACLCQTISYNNKYERKMEMAKRFPLFLVSAEECAIRCRKGGITAELRDGGFMELKVEARNVEMRQGWQDRIENEKEKLLRHYPNVLHLRVTIEATGHVENDFKVKLVAGVPGDIVVVTRGAGNVRAALTESFDVLALNLKEMQRKKRTVKKQQPAEVAGDSVGLIKKLSPVESYGFIVTPDEREIYFHENALKNVEMETLHEGDSVFFGESRGDKGPQASWVRLAG
jgi:cold shock CspA family protein/ribosome-associated translation inhibitor RaiA